MDIRAFTISSLLRRNARLFRERTAIEHEDRQITYSKLFEQVRCLSDALKAQGVCKGDRIAVLSKNSDRFFLLYLAAGYLGAILVPINPRLSADEVTHILSDSDPSMIFLESEFRDLAIQVISGDLSLRKLYLLDKSAYDMPNIASLMSWESSFAKELDQVEGSDPYIICYTAAVQGKTKGAIITHENIISCNIQTAYTMGLNSGDVHLNVLPVCHMIGLCMALSVMHAGGNNVVIEKFDSQTVLNLISEKSVTVMGTFPPILSRLLTQLSLADYDVSSLRHVYGLDQPNVLDNFERKSNSEFWSLYGQTETMLSCLSPRDQKRGSAGRPGPLVDLRIGDEYEREVKLGEHGEILVRGPLVFKGYWNQPEVTKYTLRNGWHHTGDIGHLDDDGYLWFLGRKKEKDLIKSGGENVYPIEIENVLLKHPDVREAVVFGVPDKKYGEGIVAECVLRG